jgi:hypothetical protein
MIPFGDAKSKKPPNGQFFRGFLYCCFGGSAGMGRFDHGLQAVRAHELADAVDFAVLEIGIFSGPVDRIIMAAKKTACAAHLGTFVANRTLSHEESN